jgi:hypothetical protein
LANSKLAQLVIANGSFYTPRSFDDRLRSSRSPAPILFHTLSWGEQKKTQPGAAAFQVAFRETYLATASIDFGSDIFLGEALSRADISTCPDFGVFTLC